MDTSHDPASPYAIISPQEVEALFEELHLHHLPEEKKREMIETMIDTVMDRIFLRIGPSLTEENKHMLEDLEMRPNAQQAMVLYLVSVVPNLNMIALEEIQKYKEELKQQITTIIDVLDQTQKKEKHHSKSEK